MPEIRGYATHAAGAELLAFRYDVGPLGADEVDIRISHCGICRSDLHLIDNDWQVSKYPFVPGHEIVGTLEAVGTAVENLQPGQRVGVGWQAGSCGHCAWCRQGKENLCPQAQPTCLHRNGGFADAVRVPARFVIAIPEALDSENCRAAALRRHHGVHAATQLWNFARLSRRGSWNRRARSSGFAVRADLWRGGDGLLHFADQGGRGSGVWRSSLLQHAGEQRHEGAGRLA